MPTTGFISQYAIHEFGFQEHSRTFENETARAQVDAAHINRMMNNLLSKFVVDSRSYTDGFLLSKDLGRLLTPPRQTESPSRRIGDSGPWPAICPTLSFSWDRQLAARASLTEPQFDLLGARRPALWIHNSPRKTGKISGKLRACGT